MANLKGVERAHYVQEMFTQIAGRYDLMNRLMTLGQDIQWRKEVIKQSQLPRNAKLLDLGTGTGDLAREALQQSPETQVVASDFTLEMMRVGRQNSAADQLADLSWSASDAHWLPFPNETFDAVVSGFLLRNVGDLDRCLREQFRVLKPGGRIVTLDTTPPPKSPFAPLLRFHLHTVIPSLGQLIIGQKEAYTYLPDSTEGFLEPERLAARLLSVGFDQVAFQRKMFGTVAIHWGVKPLNRKNE